MILDFRLYCDLLGWKLWVERIFVVVGVHLYCIICESDDDGLLLLCSCSSHIQFRTNLLKELHISSGSFNSLNLTEPN